MKKIKYLAIIPARGNSKRIKNKNLKQINKKTLFDYTLSAAINSKKIQKIIVTTDIKKLIKKKTKRVVYLKRPNNLVDTSKLKVILHSLIFKSLKRHVKI